MLTALAAAACLLGLAGATQSWNLATVPATVTLLLVLIATGHVGARLRPATSAGRANAPRARRIAAFLLAAPVPVHRLPPERPLWPWHNRQALRRFRAAGTVTDALDRLGVRPADLAWDRAVVRQCQHERRVLVASGEVQLTITETPGPTGPDIRCRAIPIPKPPVPTN